MNRTWSTPITYKILHTACQSVPDQCGRERIHIEKTRLQAALPSTTSTIHHNPLPDITLMTPVVRILSSRPAAECRD